MDSFIEAIWEVYQKEFDNVIIRVRAHSSHFKCVHFSVEGIEKDLEDLSIAVVLKPNISVEKSLD